MRGGAIVHFASGQLLTIEVSDMTLISILAFSGGDLVISKYLKSKRLYNIACFNACLLRRKIV